MLWPFADAEPLPGTALLAGWLARIIVTLVTGHTRPGDRVLLVAPSAPQRGLSRASGGIRGTDPYAGLTEAVWTITRLGRTADTATEPPAPEEPDSLIAPRSRRDAGPGSGARLGRCGLRIPTEPNRESERRPGRANHRPGEAFDLIITAVRPHAAGWLAHADWNTALTPTGTLALVTHSVGWDERFVDPVSTVVETLCSHGWGWLDHIAVLDKPMSRAPSPPPTTRVATDSTADVLPLRPVHHDLLLFGSAHAARAPVGERTGPADHERTETSDD